AQLFFYVVLRVPEEMARAEEGRPAPLKLWELRFSLYILVLAAGVIAAGRGMGELSGEFAMKSAIMVIG
ncbi:MAG: hypothetical protein C0608_09295, partial [Deltaproteobacteria bacterium]